MPSPHRPKPTCATSRGPRAREAGGMVRKDRRARRGRRDRRRRIQHRRRRVRRARPRRCRSARARHEASVRPRSVLPGEALRNLVIPLVERLRGRARRVLYPMLRHASTPSEAAKASSDAHAPSPRHAWSPPRRGLGGVGTFVIVLVTYASRRDDTPTMPARGGAAQRGRHACERRFDSR